MKWANSYLSLSVIVMLLPIIWTISPTYNSILILDFRRTVLYGTGYVPGSVV